MRMLRVRCDTGKNGHCPMLALRRRLADTAAANPKDAKHVGAG